MKYLKHNINLIKLKIIDNKTKIILFQLIIINLIN